MRKVIYLLLMGAMLVSCSAEKRLALFLTRHPELKRMDTITIYDTVFIQGDTLQRAITIREIQEMDSIVSTMCSANGSTPRHKNEVAEVSNSKHGASLSATGNGNFVLAGYIKPDTMVLNDTLYLPSYVTHTEYRDKIVYRMTWYEKIFFSIGVILTLLVFIVVIIRVTMRFILNR